MQAKHLPGLGASTEFACARESESAPIFERREPLSVQCCLLDSPLLSLRHLPAQQVNIRLSSMHQRQSWALLKSSEPRQLLHGPAFHTLLPAIVLRRADLTLAHWLKIITLPASGGFCSINPCLMIDEQ